MRVLHLNTYDVQGGAARAAHRLQSGLLELGHDSRMLVRHKTSTDDRIIAANLQPSGERSETLRHVFRRGVLQNRTSRSNTHFSLPEPSWDITSHPAVADSDVIHLHWVAEFLSYRSLGCLVQGGRPVVWTLHDQRAFTGGCHFSAGCTQYETDCGNCPQLQRWAEALPRAVLADARASWTTGRVTVVSPSRWLAACARRSALFRNERIEMIPYGLDTRIFCPQDRESARAEQGMAASAVVLLFGADCVHEQRKGLGAMAAGLSAAMDHGRFREAVQSGRVVLASFGDRGGEQPELDVPIRKLGRVASDEALARLYSAADAVLLPSLEDNLPNVMLEAMCCGTPVLAHGVGGVLDVIEDGRNGLLVPSGSPGAFAEALERLVFEDGLRGGMAAVCRAEMRQQYSLEVQASRYVTLYESLLADGCAPERRTGTALSPAAEWGRGFAAVSQRILRETTFSSPARRWLARLGWRVQG